MNNSYLNDLINALEATTSSNREGIVITSYDDMIEEIVGLFSLVKKAGKQVFFIGNGGSAAIASHMTADYMKNGGMKTYSLYDNSVTTCMGNDYGYEFIFSKPLSFLGNEGDMLIAISSSGNSQNIINAIEVATNKKMKVVTLTGFTATNRIRGMGDVNVHVPKEHYGIVESIHNLILQQVVDELLERDGACL